VDDQSGRGASAPLTHGASKVAGAAEPMRGRQHGPGARVRRPAENGPCAGERRGCRDPRACASAAGTRGSCCDDDCWAGTYAYSRSTYSQIWCGGDPRAVSQRAVAGSTAPPTHNNRPVLVDTTTCRQISLSSCAPRRHVIVILDAVDMRRKSTPKPTEQRYAVAPARVKPDQPAPHP
jgi:hypothetical protein